MDKKTLTELDFYRIRDEIAGFCVSEEGAYMLSHLEPLSKSDEIEARKNLSREWFTYIHTARNNALNSWQPVFPVFKMISVQGAAVSLEQLHSVFQFCVAVKNVTDAVLNAEEELNLKSLASLVRSIPDISIVYGEINRIMTSDGQLRDLPELRAIRAKIAELNAKIKSILRSFTSGTKYADILESAVPVLKNGRQVLAVKSNRRASVPGIIHEVSHTGQTVFIEPEESVRCSNELVEAEFELQAEIRRIIVDVVSKIAPFSFDLVRALKIMEKLDETRAAAVWGKANGCVFADTCKEEPLLLIGARHPLLGEKAVPVDIRFMEGKRILIITGPNTGGKTVTLKTIALFALLNQCGFPVPAKEGSRLPVFSGIYADIGDEQSLDQSLSTFSGHMKNIARAVRCAGESSLVLLDELGSGTDPQEGAAVSMAVLDRLIEKKSFVLITTHQGIIKNYGYTHPECINASVEFNSDTLSPTYRLMMGIPGESHALEIAEKSGLPKDIVQKARDYIVSEKADVSSLIKGLTQKHAELDGLLAEIKEREEALLESIRKNDLKALQLRQKEHEIKKGIQREAEDFLVQTRKDLENLVRVLKEGEVTREKTLGVRKFISDFTAAVSERDEKLSEEEHKIAEETLRLENEEKKRISHKPSKKRMKTSDALKNAVSISSSVTQENSALQKEPVFEPGAEVKSVSSNQTGIIDAPAGKGKWTVLFGSIKMTLRQSELVLVKNKTALKPSVSYSVDLAESGSAEEKPAFELRLLGLRAEEAVRALERQLDLCALNNFRQFSIIHGKGSGVLQQTVHDYLSNCPSVLNFTFAPPEDGGFGKTYVSLR